jgi:hypothetical protein
MSASSVALPRCRDCSAELRLVGGWHEGNFIGKTPDLVVLKHPKWTCPNGHRIDVLALVPASEDE